LRRRARFEIRCAARAKPKEAFDGITYSKGRAVLSMIEAWLGEDTFARACANTSSSTSGQRDAADLYAALTGASGVREVAPVMNSFTDQTGVPLVTAMLDCSRDRTSFG